MSLTLTKISETSSTITLGWTPPANVGGYVFYANSQVVSVATANLKDGSPRKEVKFSKTNPGPPFEVVAVVYPPAIESDAYPDPSPPPSGELRFGIASGGSLSIAAQVGQNIGVGIMRVFDQSPTQSVSSMASVLNVYTSRNIEPLVLVHTNTMNSNMSEFPGNLGAIAAALGPGGSQAHATFPLRWMEFGNELFYGYTGKPGPEYADEYTTGWLRGYNAVKAANPNVKIAFTLDCANEGTATFQRIASLIYGVDPQIHNKVDAWVFHHYGPITGGHTAKILGMLDAVEQRGAPTTIPIFITEDGIGSANGATLTNTHGWPSGSYETYAQAAVSHQNKLNALLAHPRIGDRLAVWMIWSDRDGQAVGTTNNAYYYMGTLKVDNSDKGAYSTFARNLATTYS